MIKRKKIYLLTIVLFLISPNLFSVKKNIEDIPKNPTLRIIEADFAREKGATCKIWQKCVGAGRANEGLRADWQDQLRLIKNECGFEYIRMHGLMHDDMGVYFEDNTGKPFYNWQYIDQLYDFLLSIKIKPFVELTFMPSALASGDKTVFWWKGNITPPKSYEKWYNLIKALTEHFTERYGVEEVKTWYFEVWNEPNHPYFFTLDINEYFKMYDTAAKAVKTVNPDYKVGGPATAGNGWVKETIEHCTTNNIPLDFIATHTYAVTKGFFDATGETGTILSRNIKSITQDVINSFNKIKASTKPNLELHYTEWSASYTPTDPIHDSYHSAAFILDKIKGTETFAASMSYWVFTDIFEEQGPKPTPFHGGFGLLNYQTIKKPAFYVYKFLNEMGNTELLNKDAASWVCRNTKGDIQVLFWDFTLTHPGDSVINQVFYKRDLPSKPKGTTCVNLSNIPAGKYALQLTRVGYKNNDAYSTYMQMGSPAQLTIQQVKVIKDINAGLPSVNEIIEIKPEGKFTYQLPVNENDVVLLKLIRL